MKRFFFSFPLAICVTAILYAGIAFAYTPPSPPAPSKNIYELIIANAKLSKFASMIGEAGLKDTLSANTGEPMTVFAPTNDALEAIPSGVMKRIEASKTSLQSFVKYHIIAGSAVSSGSISGRRISLASANGEELSLDGSDRAKPPKVENGALEQMDIGATNGVLHTVSNALVPPSLTEAPVPPPAPPSVPKPPQLPPVAASPAPAPMQVAAPTPPPAPVRITTSGVAQAPITTTTAAAKISTSAARVTTSGVATAPAAATNTTSSPGFQLFGHTFSW